ncbi:phage head-tail connector protein [Kaustia mangrovi]|uniref:Phage head-tail connector protein n=1 Tax=Kaustia mangrovi TaxID=2593653 RepID=A0A7S8C4Z4_9HYPH|nr:head-tail connector protein [Kaustia mangrovi]QPC43493.1 phage head-tail connector protein [Kaustia mangrovi]
MLAPVRTIAPAELPVSLEEAKAHLRVDHADDDTLITGLIQTATDYVDGWSGILGKCLVSQTWRLDLCGFPPWVIYLPLAPVSEIVDVTYCDEDGNQQTLSPTVYRGPVIDAYGPYLYRVESESWPSTDTRPDAVSVTFTAGYGAPSDVPQSIRHALLLLVGHWYENREATSPDVPGTVPFAVDALLAPHRRVFR